MKFDDLEAFYDRLAEAIDEAGPEKTALFLSKLALLLAREVSDPEKGRTAIDTALRDLG